jgi:hypothetical protein
MFLDLIELLYGCTSHAHGQKEFPPASGERLGQTQASDLLTKLGGSEPGIHQEKFPGILQTKEGFFGEPVELIQLTEHQSPGIRKESAPFKINNDLFGKKGFQNRVGYGRLYP